MRRSFQHQLVEVMVESDERPDRLLEGIFEAAEADDPCRRESIAGCYDCAAEQATPTALDCSRVGQGDRPVVEADVVDLGDKSSRFELVELALKGVQFSLVSEDTQMLL